MPYGGERANPLGQVSVATNPRVTEAFERWEVTQAQVPPHAEVAALCVPVEAVPGQVGNADDVSHSITVDGSDQEVEVTREYPTVKVGYICVAGSLVDLRKFRALGKSDFVDPQALRRARNEAAFDVALPGSGLQKPGKTGAETWREELTNFLVNTQIDADSPLTLADGLLSIRGENGVAASSIVIEVCPSCEYKSTGGAHGPIRVAKTTSRCPSPACGRDVFLGDALRLHNEFNPEGSNFSPITRAMNMAERLMTTCYIDHFFANAPEMLRSTLFVTDGPLALHGPSAPQYRHLLARLQYQMKVLSERDEPIPGPLLVGVEKSGPFFEHARAVRDHMPMGSVLPLGKAYINRILGRSPDNSYGSDEFYGRRFIYRTSEGDALVLTVPPRHGVTPYSSGSASEDLASFPTLRVVCQVLDSLRTRMYEDAVIPLALAHSTASLPLGVGRSVLTKLAQQHLEGVDTDHQAVKKPTYLK